jgi:hypothetical protein
MPSTKRGEWRFLARFKDSGPEDDVWIPWHKANELPALDRYSKEHPDPNLNIPDNQRRFNGIRLMLNANLRQEPEAGGFFLLSKGGVVLVVPSGPIIILTYS